MEYSKVGDTPENHEEEQGVILEEIGEEKAEHLQIEVAPHDEIKQEVIIQTEKIEIESKILSAHKKSIIGLSYMAGSALLFSIMSLLVKVLGNQGIPSFELVLFRNIIQWIIILSSLAFLRINPLGPKGSIFGSYPSEPSEKRILLCVRGGVGFISLSCFYFTITSLSLSDAVVLSFTSPVFTAILAIFILKEKWEKYDIIGAILSMTGVIMIARPAFLFGSESASNQGPETSEWARLAIVGLALFGSGMAGLAYVTVRLKYSLRKIGPSVHAMVLVNYFSVISLVLSPIMMLILGQAVWPSPEAWLPILGMGISATIGQVLLNSGLQLEKAAKATTMNYLQIVFSFTWDLAILHNVPSYWSFIGAALITGWAVIVIIKIWRSKD